MRSAEIQAGPGRGSRHSRATSELGSEDERELAGGRREGPAGDRLSLH